MKGKSRKRKENDFAYFIAMPILIGILAVTCTIATPAKTTTDIDGVEVGVAPPSESTQEVTGMCPVILIDNDVQLADAPVIEIAEQKQEEVFEVIATKYVAVDYLYKRSGPGKSYEVVETLSLNTPCNITKFEAGWCRLEDGNYVAEEYLSDDKVTIKDLGEFTITAYCREKYPHTCNSGSPYLTATETTPRPGIIAVDPKVIPLGSKVYINGNIYTAEDTGGAIKGNHIDLCVATHKEAKQIGEYKAKVELIIE